MINYQRYLRERKEKENLNEDLSDYVGLSGAKNALSKGIDAAKGMFGNNNKQIEDLLIKAVDLLDQANPQFEPIIGPDGRSRGGGYPQIDPKIQREKIKQAENFVEQAISLLRK